MSDARLCETLLVAVLAAGCTTAASPKTAADANDDVAVGRGDDGRADLADAGVAVDAGCNPCWYGHCIDPAVCLAATPIEPGVPLTMQNTGSGGYGDCASTGSSGGDPQLYYSLVIPPGGGLLPRFVRVVAAPVDPAQAAYLRVLSDCNAAQVEIGARGGASTNGAAASCASNDSTSARSVIIAVGNYSNTPGGLVFTLSAELIDPDGPCPL